LTDLLLPYIEYVMCCLSVVWYLCTMLVRMVTMKSQNYLWNMVQVSM